MADFGSPSMERCTSLAAEKKVKKRRGPKLTAEASKVVAAEEVDVVRGAATEREKPRLSQEEIDYILSWDVSEYVFKTPDNMDDMPLSDALKQRYRASRQEAIVAMREARRSKRELQERVKSELEKHGYVEVEAAVDMLNRNQLEEHMDGHAA